MSQNWNYKLLSEQILFFCHKGTVHSKLKTCWKCAHPQVIQDVDEFVSSSDLEKCSIASVSQQWILCSEWVPSEWEPNLSQILSYHNKPYINGKLIYSAFRWCINLNFEKLTLMTGFVVSCLDSHSDGTHSLQMIYCWDSDAMLHFSKSDEETNSSTSWMAWEFSFLEKKNHFRWTIPIWNDWKMTIFYCKLLFVM